MLETGVAEASEAPVLRRHVVVVLVDRLDMATARALQYARTLAPDDLRAVHFDIDTKAARELEAEWSRLGLARLPARHHRVPRPPAGPGRHRAGGRRHGSTATPSARCSCPGAAIAGVWERFLHDRTADKIAAVLGQVPHVSATIVPFAVGGRLAERARSYGRSVQRASRHGASPDRRPDGGAGVPTPDGRPRRCRDAARACCWPPTRPWPSGPARPPPSRRCRRASGSGWPAGSSRCGSSPGPAPPTSSACWATGPAGCSWSSRGGPRSPGSSRGPPGGRGHGRRLGPPAGHAQSRRSSWCRARAPRIRPSSSAPCRRPGAGPSP